MKKHIVHSFANITSNLLKKVIQIEAYSNSSLLGYEPQAPESLTHFKKEIFRKQK